MPYKFAILEASHNGAKDPKYFTESSYKKKQFTSREIEQDFLYSALLFFVSFQWNYIINTDILYNFAVFSIYLT